MRLHRARSWRRVPRPAGGWRAAKGSWWRRAWQEPPGGYEPASAAPRFTQNGAPQRARRRLNAGTSGRSARPPPALRFVHTSRIPVLDWASQMSVADQVAAAELATGQQQVGGVRPAASQNPLAESGKLIADQRWYRIADVPVHVGERAGELVVPRKALQD